MTNLSRYKRMETLDFPQRTWPFKRIEKAPIWCSVDLRDGNQALVEPMSVEEKIEMFNLLLKLGFKEIEVGFPSSSQIEFDFLRQLVERKLIPDDLQVQVLSQCREPLIERTFESVKGIKNVIMHIYNPISTLQRKVVFNKSKQEVKQIALDAVEVVKRCSKKHDGNITLEYSPESFTATELDFALEVCNEVTKAWGATPDRKVIINLPATVELSTPNIYADRIEWMNKNLENRESVILSVHPHNDRGTGVAATELSLMAGAERVEGTLFGNGERTGNVDMLILAYNMFSQGIDPNLNLGNIKEIMEVYERCTKLIIAPRHPYAGQLVFTSFSGSHQDAINKGIHAMAKNKSPYWEVPYLLIDPADIGRKYEPVVRINSQSGKGGVAFVLESFYGFQLPKGMQKEFADIIQNISELQGEVSPEEIYREFRKNYILMKEPIHFLTCQITDTELVENDYAILMKMTYKEFGVEKELEGVGRGPIDAVKAGFEDALGLKLKVLDYTEHSLNSGSNVQAASYIQLLDRESNIATYGVGIASNITRSTIRAMCSAVNRLFFLREQK